MNCVSEMVTAFKILRVSAKSASSPDWYKILQIEPFSPIQTVKKQYKTLALTLHPDKSPFRASEEAFRALSGRKDVKTSEALSIREDLSWLKENNKHRVILESDSLVAVNAINSIESGFGSFGLIVSDCKTLLDSLSDCSVVHCKRSANIVAHTLARSTNSVSDWVVWSHVPPPFILDVIADD